MSTMNRILATLLLAALAAGCASSIPMLPDARSVVISISPDPDFDLMGLGDYFIPESQVFVGGKDGGQRTGAVAFGLMGMAIGAAIDSGRNARMLNEAAKPLAIKFDRRVFEDLARRMRTDAGAGMTVVRAKDPRAHVMLVPFARFQSPDGGPPTLSFTLQAHMGELKRSGYTDRKTYFHPSTERRPFSGDGNGWGDAQGAAFDAAATTAFARLVEVFMADLRGELGTPAQNDPRPRVKWQAIDLKGDPQLANGLLLREMPDYVVVAPVQRDIPVGTSIVVVERTLLRD